MLYDKTFDWLEGCRWNLGTDIPWQEIRHDLVSHDDLRTLKLICVAEFTALEASRVFLRDFQHDVDFNCFVSIWFYEELKHHFVLKQYLKHFGVELEPALLASIGSEQSGGSLTATLTMHMLGEIKLHNWYIRSVQFFREPVLKRIFRYIAADELRHGKVYYQFLERITAGSPEELLRVLRVVRLMGSEDGDVSRHPVPQLVNASGTFDFGQEMAAAFERLEMDAAHRKAEKMEYQWLSRLCGIPIRDRDGLEQAIKQVRRRTPRPVREEASTAC
jgi:hypothetical protein